jgi:hypothetical protein
MNRWMKWPAFLLSAAWLVAFPVRAQETPSLNNTLEIQVGDNYFGQSVALSAATRLGGPFWGGLSLELGNLTVESDANSSFYVFHNPSSTDFTVGLDLHPLASLWLAFHRSDSGEFRWLNSLGLGLSYFDSTLQVSFLDPTSASHYEGQKDLSAFALYADLHLLDFYPPNDSLFFSLGAKCSTALIASPQTVITANASGQTASVSYGTDDGSPITVPYVELFLSLGRGFN